MSPVLSSLIEILRRNRKLKHTGSRNFAQNGRAGGNTWSGCHGDWAPDHATLPVCCSINRDPSGLNLPLDYLNERRLRLSESYARSRLTDDVTRRWFFIVCYVNTTRKLTDDVSSTPISLVLSGRQLRRGDWNEYRRIGESGRRSGKLMFGVLSLCLKMS